MPTYAASGPEEIAKFLRNYGISSQVINNLHNLQISVDSFSLQPAEILRVLGVINEVEIHNIASDWREFRAKGYSPSYIDRILMNELGKSRSTADPSLGELPSARLPSPTNASNQSSSESASKSVTFSTTVVSSAPPVQTNVPLSSSPTSASTNTKTKVKADLIDLVQELRTLLEQRTVENDYLRLQSNSQVEDIERRAKEFKEMKDECKIWKKSATELQAKLTEAHISRDGFQIELEDTQKILVEKNLFLFKIQEDLNQCQQREAKLEFQIQELRKKAAPLPRRDISTQYDTTIQLRKMSTCKGNTFSLQPDISELSRYLKTDWNGLDIINVNDEDERLMSQEFKVDSDESSLNLVDIVQWCSVETDTVDLFDEIQTESIGVNTESINVITESIGVNSESIDLTTESIGVNTDTPETETNDDRCNADVPFSNRIMVSVKNDVSNPVLDPWPYLSYAQLLEKHRTLTEESTVWQKKQYQELMDAEAEVLRLQVVLQSKEEESLVYQEKYERLLSSSMSEIHETAIKEKAQSEELISTLQQQREGLLSKVVHLQQIIDQNAILLVSKDAEIDRLQSLLQLLSKESKTTMGNSSHLETKKEKEGAVHVSNNPSVTVAESNPSASGHADSQWEEKEKMYLMDIDHLSTSLRELTAAFHRQQNLLQSVAPVAVADRRNSTRGEAMKSNQSPVKEAGRNSRLSKSETRPNPPTFQTHQQPPRPKSSHGYAPSAVVVTEAGQTTPVLNDQGRNFPHRHRLIKSAPRHDTRSESSANVDDDERIEISPTLDVQDQYLQNNQATNDSFLYSDNEPSENGCDDEHVLYFEHDDFAETSPTTKSPNSKHTEKEQRDALLTKAYDPESLRRIYFHPANKSSSRPLTGNNNNSSRNPSVKARPTSSGGPSNDSRKSSRPRSRTSLVANFIHGLELRYNEELAQLIHVQQEEEASFYDHLAVSVGRPTTGSKKTQESNAATEGSASNAKGSSERIKTLASRQKEAPKPRAARVPVEHLGENERGNYGGGFYIAPVPSDAGSGHTKRASPRIVSQKSSSLEDVRSNPQPQYYQQQQQPQQQQQQKQQKEQYAYPHPQPYIPPNVVSQIEQQQQQQQKQQKEQNAYPHPQPYIPPNVVSQIEQLQQQQQKQQKEQNAYPHAQTYIPPNVVSQIEAPTYTNREEVFQRDGREYHSDAHSEPATMHSRAPVLCAPHRPEMEMAPPSQQSHSSTAMASQSLSHPSISSVGSSSLPMSQTASQFSSPSMILHPSDSQQQEEFFAYDASQDFYFRHPNQNFAPELFTSRDSALEAKVRRYQQQQRLSHSAS
jgi:hypothetical protein